MAASLDPETYRGQTLDQAFQLFQNSGYCVQCYIEVENKTGIQLIHEHSFISRGYVSSTPSNIKPNYREAFYAHKNGGTATGSSGVASWIISGTKQRLVVMWSAPYNFNHHSNWLAVGITEKAISEDTFNEMYYDAVTWFQRKEYYHTCDEVTYQGQMYKVKGTMGTDHTPLIKVSFST